MFRFDFGGVLFGFEGLLVLILSIAARGSTTVCCEFLLLSQLLTLRWSMDCALLSLCSSSSYVFIFASIKTAQVVELVLSSCLSVHLAVQ